MVRRSWAGPARISGPAGTGKTVVGLHRTAHLAQRSTRKVLYVTHANNIPRVQGTFLQAMAPAIADRVEFRSIHAWAQDFLRSRGIDPRLHGDKAETAFSHAWKDIGRNSRLAEIDPSHVYWRDEIVHVIKGRGITSFEQYAAVRRLRRRTRLGRAHRETVWALYEEYERNLRAKDVRDFQDVLALALAEARGLEGSPYGAIVADEIQDLSLVGVQLLHALVGDTPSGLLLIGDGQQTVYPGGFRLSDAGVDIRGNRGQVLRVNYRNAEEILEAALAVVAEDSFEDIDGTFIQGRRDVELTYHDGHVVRVSDRTPAEHDQSLLTALHTTQERESTNPGRTTWGDHAVLCSSHRAVERYQQALRQAGIPVCQLDHYDGQPVEAVKLGTYRRSKGLEFKHVYLPQYDSALRDSADGTQTAQERHELARSQLFVAMTRARDTLWLGSVQQDGAAARADNTRAGRPPRQESPRVG